MSYLNDIDNLLMDRHVIIPFLKKSGPNELAQEFCRYGHVAIDKARIVANQLNMTREQFDTMDHKELCKLLKGILGKDVETIHKLEGMRNPPKDLRPKRPPQIYGTHNQRLDRVTPAKKNTATRVRTYNQLKHRGDTPNPYCVHNSPAGSEPARK